jgi:tetratricopeptide (TPR) repeat protein
VKHRSLTLLLVAGSLCVLPRGAVATPGGPSSRLVAAAERAEALADQDKVADAILLLQPSKDAPGSAGRRVRLTLGELLIQAGRRAEAEPILRSFADDYDTDAIGPGDAEGLAMVGRAMHLLRHVKDANRAFNESERALRASPGAKNTTALEVRILLWRADLFADNSDPGHAEEVLKLALREDPRSVDAMVGLARLRVEAFDFDAAAKIVESALAIDPSNARALGIRAGMALHDMDIAAADLALDAGLSAHPGNLALRSLRAAARFLDDDRPGFEAAKRDVFARNKGYSTFYTIVSEYAEWEHRYDDIIGMMKSAVLVDPEDAKAWAELGLMQTRAGDEATGIQSLQEAWKRDHFDVRVYNTLELFYGKWIPEQYATTTFGFFSFRTPKDEKPVLERYAPRMLNEAWTVFKAHYGFTPVTPVYVEMYASRDQFSVRSSGLPNLGIEGVCFGHVVSALSPRAEPFNWGNVLWHELGHVFAIQLSKNHVPRWFTEGLSEYETMIRRPEWRRELDPELYVALERHSLPSVIDMNRAFSHADSAVDVTVAYYAASQMVAFAAERFGFPKIDRALTLWGEGRRTGEVLTQAFGTSAAEFDAAFGAWAHARLSRYAVQYLFDVPVLAVEEAAQKVTSDPKSAQAHVVLAVALFHDRKVDDARREVEQALALDPACKNAHYVAAKIAAALGQEGDALKEVAALRAQGADGYAVQMEVADLAARRHDDRSRRLALEAARRFDPTQVEPLHALYDLAHKENRADDELRALTEIAKLDQHDRTVYGLLLGRLVSLHKWDEAKAVGESALYVDVENQDIHVDYARALSATGDHAQASYELESALLCDGQPRGKAAVHVLLARERASVGDMAGARAHRDQALTLDPGNAEARGLGW